MKFSLFTIAFCFLHTLSICENNNNTTLISNQLTDLNKVTDFCYDSIKKHKSHFISFLKYHDTPVMNLNLQQGWRTMGEIAFGLCDYSSSYKNLLMRKLSCIEAGSQFNFNLDHFIIGPELTYNHSDFIVNFGGSIIYFTDLRKGTLFINPHVGLSYNTIFDLYFGYNIPLMQNHMKSLVNNYTITLAVPILKRYNTM